MGIGFGIGIPLDWAAPASPSRTSPGRGRATSSTVVAFGVLAAIAAFYARGRRPGIIGRPLSYVGKMALTCYILQNLICSLIFYDYGLGLARRFPDVDNTVLTMVVYASRRLRDAHHPELGLAAPLPARAGRVGVAPVVRGDLPGARPPRSEARAAPRRQRHPGARP